LSPAIPALLRLVGDSFMPLLGGMQRGILRAIRAWADSFVSLHPNRFDAPISRDTAKRRA